MEQAGETPESQPAGTKRWLTPMVLWTAGILLALGLVWLVAAVGVPYWQVRREVSEASLNDAYPVWHDFSEWVMLHEPSVARLGGPERAAAKLALYLRLPRFMTDRRGQAVRLLGCCGQPAIPGLIRALSDPHGNVRLFAVEALGGMGPEAASAVPALEKLLQDEDKSLRRAAEVALVMIRYRR